MALKPCERCGVIGRPDDDACWSCGRPPRSTVALPVSAAGERRALWPVLVAILIVGLQFLIAALNPEMIRLRLGCVGALGATAAAGLVFGWRRNWVLSTAFAAGGASAAFYGHIQPVGYAVQWLVAAALPFHVILRGLPGKLDRLPTLGNPWKRAPELEDDEERTLAKLREIEAHRERIGRSRALLARERDAKPLASVRDKLEHADEVLRRQRSRHTAHLWAIEAVRWQHRLAPVVAGLDRPGGDPERRLERLAAASGEGRRLLHDLERDRETAASREGKRCLGQLRALLARCDEMREAVVVSHALHTIRHIDPTDDAERTAALSPEPLESLRSHSGSLTAALAAFELEHERLRDDDRDAEEVARLVRELEREG